MHCVSGLGVHKMKTKHSIPVFPILESEESETQTNFVKKVLRPN